MAERETSQHVSTHILSSGNSDCGQSGKQISMLSGWMGLRGYSGQLKQEGVGPYV